jgi:hypothetical protein
MICKRYLGKEKERVKINTRVFKTQSEELRLEISC